MKQFYDDIISCIIQEESEYLEELKTCDRNIFPSLDVDSIFNRLDTSFIDKILEEPEKPGLGVQLLYKCLGIESFDFAEYNNLPITKLLGDFNFIKKDVILTAFCIVDKYLNNGKNFITPTNAYYNEIETAIEFIKSKKSRLSNYADPPDEFFETYLINQNATQNLQTINGIDDKFHIVGPFLKSQINIDMNELQSINDSLESSKNKEDSTLSAMIDDWNAIAAQSIKKSKEANRLLYEVPGWGYQYRMQSLIHTKSLPWGCKSDSKYNRRFTYSMSSNIWEILTNYNISKPTDWYLFECNTGFNLSLMLFSLTYKNGYSCIHKQIFDFLKTNLSVLTDSPLIIGRIKLLKIALQSIFDFNKPISTKQVDQFNKFLEHYSNICAKFQDVVFSFINIIYYILRKESDSYNEAFEKMYKWLKNIINEFDLPEVNIYHDKSNKIFRYNPGNEIRSASHIYFSNIYKMIYSSCSSLQINKYINLIKTTNN